MTSCARSSSSATWCSRVRRFLKVVGLWFVGFWVWGVLLACGVCPSLCWLVCGGRFPCGVYSSVPIPFDSTNQGCASRSASRRWSSSCSPPWPTPRCGSHRRIQTPGWENICCCCVACQGIETQTHKHPINKPTNNTTQHRTSRTACYSSSSPSAASSWPSSANRTLTPS